MVAILSIASAALLVRWADAPALALAFWRTLGGAVLLAPAAFRSDVRPNRATLPSILIAGLALALHFGAWLASLELTTVAASVTLVTTVPIFVALYYRNLRRQAWFAVGLAMLGSLLITGGDIVSEPGNVNGDLLAIVGAIAMAAYLIAGDTARQTMPTAAYAAPTYAIAASALSLIAVLTNVQLTGFDRSTWLAIAAMTLGPQLGGHTVLNSLLKRLGSVTISLALLTEPIGASALAWVFLNERPPPAAWLGAPLILIGLVLVLTNHQRYETSSL